MMLFFIHHSAMLADIALIGLGVMGSSLALNLAEKKFQVSVWDRHFERTQSFLKQSPFECIQGYAQLDELVQSLAKPRIIFLMIKAGEPVEQMIAALSPLLEAGDIIIDGGNSHFEDTERRVQNLAQKGLHFIGCGVSGGEAGARHGPAMMPGGDEKAWPRVKPILQRIAAQVDGVPCCQWIGSGGSGHYVKMVHNGIEYGDMQLIAESWHFMQAVLQLSDEQIQAVFTDWNQGPLSSYLIEITAKILAYREDGELLLPRIKDSAGQKGTGKWTAINALQIGIPLTLISEAVFARYLSTLIEQRQQAAQLFAAPPAAAPADIDIWINRLEQALYAAKIISYAQGYMLMQAADQQYGWQLRLGDIALIWRGGCIIRSRFLNNIHEAYEQQPDLANLILAPFFQNSLQQALPAWRQVAALAVERGLPMPAILSGLSFLEAYRHKRLPAHLIQAQRDYFGAHGFERWDKEGFFHSDWGQ